MPRNVELLNLNTESDYPICRFQIVQHTEDVDANDADVVQNQSKTTKANLSTDRFYSTVQNTTTPFESTGTINSSQTIAQSIATMHRRATELLQRMSERKRRLHQQQQHHRTSRPTYLPNDTYSYSSLASLRSEHVNDRTAYSSQNFRYLDSGGSMHGPMDQKHSTRLGNISRSGTLIPGSRHYLMDSSHHHTERRQSDVGVWGSRSDAFSSPTTHISRWASLQNTGSQGVGRGSSANRYTTTLTRQHIRRQRHPVEVVVKQAPSIGASKVDLISIENRRDCQEQHQQSERERRDWQQQQQQQQQQHQQSERERRLYEELNNTRRELQQFKRSHSLSGDHHLLSPQQAPPVQRIKSTSSQYLNENTWTTHTLKKNDGLPCGARLAPSPQRATSHNYLPGRGNFENKQWVSEASLGRHHRLPTQGGGYSARRQNEQRMNERRLGNTSRSNRYTDNTNNRYGGASVSDFLEDISLEPIGAGVHDLDNPHGSIARSQRANTPTGSRTPGFDNTDAFRTAGTSHMHHQVHQYSGAPSPITQQNSFQEQSSFRGTDQHFRGSLQSVPHARASTVPPNYVGGVSGASGFGNLTDRERELMERVKATYRDWYLPQKQRIEVENMLRDKEPGSFIIRNSLSRVDSFAMAIKSPDDFSNTSRTSDYSNSGPVKHFIISTVSSSDGRNDGVQLLGFDNQAIFPNLVSFVFHHCVHPRAFPCTLRLPTTSNRQPIRDYGSLDRHRSKMSNGGAGDVGIRADMVYLGNQYVDRLEGDAAIRQAVTHVISKANENSQGLPDRSDVVVDVTPQSGIRISGRCRQGMVDHNLQPHKILYSAVDPECRIYVDQGLRNRQMYHAKLFGIVVRSKNLLMHGKKVHVFAEIDPNQSAHTLIQYINNIFRR